MAKTVKTNKVFLVFAILVGLVIGVGLGFYSGNLYLTGEVHFSLKGNPYMEVEQNKEYNDPGFNANIYGEDVSEDVVVTGTVDTSTCGIYVISYTLEKESIDMVLSRSVKVVLEGELNNGEISFHFLELGNKYNGDSIYIKSGETDILIDAGSRASSAETIANYINNYCTDGKLEYVIATHAHQDHIAAFVGSSSCDGIFERYEIETLIDFGLTNATSKVYENYVSMRDDLVASGTEYYTQKDCYYETNGAKRSYEISDNVTMNILYNYFCENVTKDENDYSVCTLFQAGDSNFLLTGDLEAEGEELLVENNELPEVELFKGGHHGSYTASTDTLLSVINPKIVTVTCCVGSDEFTDTDDNQFPSQAFINRVGKYTESIYATTLSTGDSYTSMNGNIVVEYSSGVCNVNCSNNNTILKDTDWFSNHRIWPSI